jgi:hypothetical protein
MKFKIERTPEEKAKISESHAKPNVVQVSGATPPPQPASAATVNQGESGNAHHHLNVRSSEHGEEHHIKLR